jgi:hypothetical protein
MNTKIEYFIKYNRYVYGSGLRESFYSSKDIEDVLDFKEYFHIQNSRYNLSVTKKRKKYLKKKFEEFYDFDGYVYSLYDTKIYKKTTKVETIDITQEIRESKINKLI